MLKISLKQHLLDNIKKFSTSTYLHNSDEPRRESHINENKATADVDFPGQHCR